MPYDETDSSGNLHITGFGPFHPSWQMKKSIERKWIAVTKHIFISNVKDPEVQQSIAKNIDAISKSIL